MIAYIIYKNYTVSILLYNYFNIIELILCKIDISMIKSNVKYALWSKENHHEFGTSVIIQILIEYIHIYFV